MNILFDHQIFSTQDYGGISRYHSELLRLLPSQEGITADIIVRYSNNKLLKKLESVSTRSFFPHTRFKGRNDIIRVLNQVYFKKEFPRRPAPDLFHPTYYHPYFLDVIGNVPIVITIHDMAHEIFPQCFQPLDFTRKHKKILAERAAKIIAVSENTKRDIINILGVPESKIAVIFEGTDANIFTNSTPTFPLPEKYILYVGARNTYKNFLFFLRATKPIVEKHKDYFIVCIGGRPFSNSEHQYIEQVGLRGKVIRMTANDSEMGFVYAHARAFVYPSLYEGFGIPVVEAFANRCPVVLSDRGSLPEVGGDAAVYFDPENVENCGQVLEQVITQSDLADEMRNKGTERAKNFTWEQTARETAKLYKTLVNNS